MGAIFHFHHRAFRLGAAGAVGGVQALEHEALDAALARLPRRSANSSQEAAASTGDTMKPVPASKGSSRARRSRCGSPRTSAPSCSRS